MKKILLAVFTLALALGSSMPVYAATQTTTMPVSVTIAQAVTVSATGLNFGTVAPGTFDAYGNATITVNAASDTPYSVTLDAGLNMDSGFRRVMSGTTSGGHYYLSQNADWSILWGDWPLGTTVPNGFAKYGTGTGANQALTVYGQLYPDAGAGAGVYTDTITVTVNY